MDESRFYNVKFIMKCGRRLKDMRVWEGLMWVCRMCCVYVICLKLMGYVLGDFKSKILLVVIEKWFMWDFSIEFGDEEEIKSRCVDEKKDFGNDCLKCGYNML